MEPCTIQDIKRLQTLQQQWSGSGQVLTCPYSFEKARLVIREMADLLALDLVDKRLVTDQLTLTVGYDIENLKNPEKKLQRGSNHGPLWKKNSPNMRTEPLI